MASIDAMELAKDEGFQRRVKHFMQKAAIAVMAELLNTTGHNDRVIYAKKVLDGSASTTEYAIAVVTNSTVAAAGESVSDNDLEFTVNSMFTAFSGFETGAAS